MGKRRLGRPRRRWEDIRIVLAEVLIETQLIEDRNQWRAFVYAALNLREQ
mgnify:CR=1 FL=1